MANIITVRPKTGSKRFKAIKGQMTQFQKINEAGQDVDRSAGEYKSERFPNSRQMFRPMWSASQRKWILHGFEKMDDKKQSALNELVKSCKLKYPKGDPKERQDIVEADIYDPNDPFFNHRSLKVITYEGQITLDKDRPLDKVILLGLMSNNEFEKGGEKINPILSQRVRYVITDKTIDTTIKKKNRERVMTATKLYDKLNDKKRMKIAMAMGLISNEQVDRALIDELLWDASQDDRSKVDNKYTKQELFIAMCEASNEELNTRHMIQKAKASGKLKKLKNQGWLLFGEPVGRTDGQVYEYFNNPENQDMMIRLEQALEND